MSTAGFKGLQFINCSDSLWFMLGATWTIERSVVEMAAVALERLQQDGMRPKSASSISLPHSFRLPTRQHTEAQETAIFTLALWQSQSIRTPWPYFSYEAWASLPFHKTAWIMEFTILLTHMWNCIGTICICRAVANCWEILLQIIGHAKAHCSCTCSEVQHLRTSSAEHTAERCKETEKQKRNTYLCFTSRWKHYDDKKVWDRSSTAVIIVIYICSRCDLPHVV